MPQFNRDLMKHVRRLVADEKIERDSPLYGLALKLGREGLSELTTGQRYVVKSKLLPLIREEDPGFDLDGWE